MADKIKLALAALLVVAGIAGYYLLAANSIVLRFLAVLAGIVAGIAVAWTSVLGQEFLVFAREALVEVKKVVWPTRKETMQTTAAVVCTVSLRVGQTTFFTSTRDSRANARNSFPGALVQATAAPATNPATIARMRSTMEFAASR